MKRNKTLCMTMVAVGTIINMIGSFLAMQLKLPIYLDNIGTVIIAMLLGNFYSICCIVVGSIVNGIFDPFAIYYMPSGILIALMASYVFHSKKWGKRNLFLKALIVTIPSTIVASMITTYLFGGITSSGSTYVIQILNKMGLDLITSSFLVQVVTDYVDRVVILFLGITIVKRMPRDILMKVEES
ncbi:ECF transporter S component [Garciella nitratireducens]|uniref:Energy-coupling factor transport system substrate-specific component n=1 Tax=Garciella nitratireducens DSM 15102 TaxID=1121911 RepID=A0A1T4MEE8_9FIRM|nr:ECF transporter S component [Garciella nitratireducens]SJZ65124.1 energy-coupling factor transport system substrate-specific component [Garciella nitratireducens DSM 15102]